MLLIASLTMLFSFIIWAHFAILDEVKRGAGKVVPSRQMQVIQSLEGGIVGAIMAQEGDIVQQDQPLLQIADTKFASEFGEIRERRGAMAARVARLAAEAQGRALTFPNDLSQVAASAVDNEKSVFEAHAHKLAQDVDVLNQQQTRLSENMKSFDREVELTRKLYAQKV